MVSGNTIRHTAWMHPLSFFDHGISPWYHKMHNKEFINNKKCYLGVYIHRFLRNYIQQDNIQAFTDLKSSHFGVYLAGQAINFQKDVKIESFEADIGRFCQEG
jgi:hypothetical protein